MRGSRHARETKVGRKTFPRQLSHRNAASLSLFLSPFFLPGGAAGDELSLPPDLQSQCNNERREQSCCSERWSEAVEKGISARRSCSCCRSRRHTTWEKDRERGWESGGRIEQCTGPPRAGGRASDRGRDKSRGEKSNSTQGREKHRRHRGSGGRGGGGKVRRRPTSQAAAAAAVTIICPSPPRPMHAAAAAAVPEASAARAHSYLDS